MNVDVFEQVRTGEITPEQGADLLAKQREAGFRPSRPEWLPRPLYTFSLLVLALILPRLVGRSS